jgi:hypothetical protein
MDWARILAYVTGMVDQELPARNEYLVAENRILKAQLKGRLKPRTPWRTNVSLVFSIRRMVPESSAAARPTRRG